MKVGTAVGGSRFRLLVSCPASALLALGTVTATWCGTGVAFAQGLDAAQNSAFEQSFVLRSDQARQSGAEARLRGTLDAFMPSVALGGSTPLDSKIRYHPDIPLASYGPDTTARRDATQYGITASLPLFDGLQRWNTMLSARSQAEAGRKLTIDVRQQLLLDTATAYLAVQRDRRILAQRHAQIESIRSVERSVQALLVLNEATRTDAALAASRVADAQAGIDQAGADLRASEIEFIRLTGRPPGRLETIRPPVLPRDEAEFGRLVLERNPKLAAARLDAQAAGFLAEAAKGALLPQVGLEFTHGRETDITGTLRSVNETTTRIRAKIPIYEPGAFPKIAEASAFARQRWYDTEDAIRQTVAAARATFQRRSALGAQTASLAARIVALKAAVRGYEIERGAGFRTVIDELNSRSELAQAEILLATGECERDRLGFLLAAAMGSLAGAPTAFGVSAGTLPMRPDDPLATRGLLPVPTSAIDASRPGLTQTRTRPELPRRIVGVPSVRPVSLQLRLAASPE